MGGDRCAVDLGNVSDEISSYSRVFDSAVAGTSTAIACAATALLIFRIICIYRRGTDVCQAYSFSFVASLILQIVGYVAVWCFRAWRPGAVNEPFCRAGVFISSVAEAVASFTVLYVVSDRISYVCPVHDPRKQQNQSTQTQIPVQKETPWKAALAVFLFWGSAVISGMPVVISSTVRTVPGTVPVCGMWGYDGVAHLVFHTTIVYIMPVSLLLTKNASSQKEPVPDGHWPFVRRALIFYALHFLLTVPMIVAKCFDYVFKCAPFVSAVRYYELVATLIFLFRLFNYISVFKVLERDVPRPKDGKEGDLRESEKCGGRYSCRKLFGLGPCVVCRAFRSGLARIAENVKKMCRGVRGCRKGRGADDEEKKKGLPSHDELSVTVEEDVDRPDDNKKGFDNPGYDDSDGDSGYAVEVLSVAGDSDQRSKDLNETEFGERGQFVGENDASNARGSGDLRPPATQDGVVLYAGTDYIPGETTV